MKVDVPFGAPPATLETAPAEAKPKKPRGRRTLRVTSKAFAGKVVFTPVYGGEDWLVEVRPRRRRAKNAASAILSDIARGILFDAAKKAVAAKKKARKG